MFLDIFLILKVVLSQQNKQVRIYYIAEILELFKSVCANGKFIDHS